MTTKRLLISMALGLASVAVLTGCDDPRAKVELHEPGKYMGPTDPLLEKTKGDANDEALKSRFAQIQRDR